MNPGSHVKHERFGVGTVDYDKGATVVVRFKHGLEECEKTVLTSLLSPLQVLEEKEWHVPLEVIVRAQAEAIQSINDAWGVFSPSRIALLPHQLWVCRQVLEKWPTRWLVADDVGLGKTIEAGLILWPLIAKGTVRRLLIICPSSLVEQWQYRLRTMFDIRLVQYVREADTPKTDFWGTHNQVVVSLETIRLDKEGRQEERQNRIFEAPAWDLLIVDEAHHLNADEDAGPTLGHKLVRHLIAENLVTSVVFFTGTPHRGKNFGFLSLASLLRPDLFDPTKEFTEQLPKLTEVMIRNNKQSVTDLKGNKLFKPPSVKQEEFGYSPEETRFYNTLTEFILTGKTYASSLSSTEGRAVMLVLIALQKLASSSVAAIRRSLKGRLKRIRETSTRLENLKSQKESQSPAFVTDYSRLEQTENIDELSKREELIAELSAALRLMANEEQRLQELVDLANEVTKETKIDKIVGLVDEQFGSRSILFFTEYKATQSLLISALIKRFGNGCATFINGEDKAEDVLEATGNITTLYEMRSNAADKFNAGDVRFLVSTEAGGEGIDLQENCYTLIHVDLPWNPMRLHQRVGRLNRYGQTEQVEVVSFRNPDTVESLIWEKLNVKISNIMMAFEQIMDEPEDLLQLVLGMTSPSVFRELFSGAEGIQKASLSEWFDTKIATFGGKDVVETVKELVGHTTKFDFQEVSSQIPKVDLPALRSFILSMLTLNGRRPTDDETGLSFKTPEVWHKEPGVRSSYNSLIFDRQNRSKDAAQRILGVGHKIVNMALRQAKDYAACVASVPPNILSRPIFVFAIHDQVTGGPGPVNTAIIAAQLSAVGGHDFVVLRDWELLEALNALGDKRDTKKFKATSIPVEVDLLKFLLKRATNFTEERLKQLGLPFRLPKMELLTILWPATETEDSHAEADDVVDTD